jgi:hypothetical protein
MNEVTAVLNAETFFALEDKLRKNRIVNSKEIIFPEPHEAGAEEIKALKTRTEHFSLSYQCGDGRMGLDPLMKVRTHIRDVYEHNAELLNDVRNGIADFVPVEKGMHTKDACIELLQRLGARVRRWESQGNNVAIYKQQRIYINPYDLELFVAGNGTEPCENQPQSKPFYITGMVNPTIIIPSTQEQAEELLKEAII